ncbi:mucin-like protein 1 [Cebus imitator]|uniref:Mucin like 1 n=1 Tax=Cebus imitator TaxID=2715852 RepID=A0A2K5QH98_CEBIM|nr:mucin-like protein 1 [Cebus imitator]
MKFLAVLVLLGVSTLLVSAQTATTPVQEETGPAGDPDDTDSEDVTTTAAATTAAATTATTAAATTATTAAATTATTTAATTAPTAASTTARRGFPDLPKWLQDILNGKLLG